MAIKLTSMLSSILLLAAIGAGPYAVYLAVLRGFWRAIGAILGGMSLGLAGLFASLKASDMYFQAIERKNDMFGFGQVLWGFFGLIYFLIVLVIVLLVSLSTFMMNRKSQGASR